MTFQVGDIGAILPEIILALWACAILLLDPFISKEDRPFLAYFSLAALVFAMLATGRMMWAEVPVFNGLYLLDPFSNFFKMLIYMAAGMTILISMPYIRREKIELGEYYGFILLAACGMMIMVSAADLIMVFLGLELMSITFYVLVGFKRFEAKSLEAAAKYFILGSFSSAILLFGISLIYGLAGSTRLEVIAQTIQSSGGQGPVWTLAVILLVVGFGFKVAVVPFHMWTPDVYEGAPTPVTAFLSVGSKAASFAVFLRVFLEGFGGLHPDWQSLLIILAIVTMAIGNIVALAQTNIKRMLAYSSIAHAGYVLIGLIVGDEMGILGLMMYLLVYTFMTLGAFAVVTLLERGGKETSEISDFTGLARRNGFAAFAMLIFMFSLTGIPPTAGFIGKFYIFMAAVQADLVWLVVIGVLFTAVSAYYYLRVVVLMYMKEPEEGVSLATPRTTVLVLAVAALLVLGAGIYPSVFLDLARDAVLQFR